MAVISGGDGGNIIVGTDADDTIYGHSVADTLPNVGQITATLVASGFSSPVFATSAPGDPNRLYVVEKDVGRIVLLDLSTGARSTFLSIPTNQLSTGGEQGLLSVAFHPDYQSNGRFFVNLVNANGDVEVRSYTRSAANPDVANSAGTTVITVPHPGQTNHNGGTVAFGPDGYLYVSIGDGGGGGDPGENAQNLNSLLGKILRLDVNSDAFPSDAARNYAIPSTNPFVGAAGADEIWRTAYATPGGSVSIPPPATSISPMLAKAPARRSIFSPRALAAGITDGTHGKAPCSSRGQTAPSSSIRFSNIPAPWVSP